MWKTDVDEEALYVARACDDELTAERVSWDTRAEQAKAERYILDNCIHELEADAATRNGEFGVIVRPVRSLEECVPACESHGSTVEVRARENLDKVSKFRFLVEGLC